MPFASQAVRLFYNGSDDPPIVPSKRQRAAVALVPTKKRKVKDTSNASCATDKIAEHVEDLKVKLSKGEAKLVSVEPAKGASGRATRAANGRAAGTAAAQAPAPRSTPNTQVEHGPISCFQCGSTKTWAWRRDANKNKICDTCRSRNRTAEIKKAQGSLPKAEAVRKPQHTAAVERRSTRDSSKIADSAPLASSSSVPLEPSSTMTLRKRRVSEASPVAVEPTPSNQAVSHAAIGTAAAQKKSKMAKVEPVAGPSAPLTRSTRKTSQAYTAPSTPSQSTRSKDKSPKPAVSSQNKVAAMPNVSKAKSDHQSHQSAKPVAGKSQAHSELKTEADVDEECCADCGSLVTAQTWRRLEHGGFICNKCKMRRWRASKKGGKAVVKTPTAAIITPSASTRSMRSSDTVPPLAMRVYGLRTVSRKTSSTPRGTRQMSDLSLGETRTAAPSYSLRQTPTKTAKVTAAACASGQSPNRQGAVGQRLQIASPASPNAATIAKTAQANELNVTERTTSTADADSKSTGQPALPMQGRTEQAAPVFLPASAKTSALDSQSFLNAPPLQQKTLSSSPTRPFSAPLQVKVPLLSGIRPWTAPLVPSHRRLSQSSKLDSGLNVFGLVENKDRPDRNLQLGQAHLDATPSKPGRASSAQGHGPFGKCSLASALARQTSMEPRHAIPNPPSDMLLGQNAHPWTSRAASMRHQATP